MNNTQINYWKGLLILYPSYEKKAQIDNEGILKIVKQAKSDLLDIKSHTYLQESNVSPILESLKHVKNYVTRHQKILDIFLHVLGIKKNVALKELNNIISSIEKDVHEVEEKKNQYLSSFTEKDREFLKLFTQMKDLIDKGERLLGEEDLSDAEANSLAQQLVDQGERLKPFSSYLSALPQKKMMMKALWRLKNERNGQLKSYFYNKLKINDSAIFAIKDIKKVMKFSKFSSRKQLPNLLEKATSLLEKVKNGEPIKREDQLTLREFALFDILPENPKEIPILQRCGVLEEIKDLEILEKMNTLKQEIMEEIKTQLQDPEILPSGCFNFHNVFDAYAVYGKKSMTFMGAVEVIATRSTYNHTGIIYKNLEEGSFFQSHVQGEHINKKLGFFDLTVGRFIALDWKKLVNEENQKKLQEAYGKNWEKIVQSHYESVCALFHANGDFSNISNQFTYRYSSILKPYFQQAEIDFENVVFKDRDMFCSQFTGMATAVTLNMLNERLLQDEALKDQFFTQEIVNSPFSKNTNFSAMHPGRLAEILKDYTKPTAPIPLIEKMVNRESTLRSFLKKIYS